MSTFLDWFQKKVNEKKATEESKQEELLKDYRALLRKLIQEEGSGEERLLEKIEATAEALGRSQKQQEFDLILFSEALRLDAEGNGAYPEADKAFAEAEEKLKGLLKENEDLIRRTEIVREEWKAARWVREDARLRASELMTLKNYYPTLLEDFEITTPDTIRVIWEIQPVIDAQKRLGIPREVEEEQ